MENKNTQNVQNIQNTKNTEITLDAIKEVCEKLGIEVAVAQNSINFVVGNEVILQGLLANGKIVLSNGKFTKNIGMLEYHLKRRIKEIGTETLKEKFKELNMRDDYEISIQYPNVRIQSKDLILKFKGTQLVEIKILTPEGTQKLKEIINII